MSHGATERRIGEAPAPRLWRGRRLANYAAASRSGAICDGNCLRSTSGARAQPRTAGALKFGVIRLRDCGTSGHPTDVRERHRHRYGKRRSAPSNATMEAQHRLCTGADDLDIKRVPALNSKCLGDRLLRAETGREVLVR